MQNYIKFENKNEECLGKLSYLWGQRSYFGLLAKKKEKKRESLHKVIIVMLTPVFHFKTIAKSKVT